MLGFTLIIIFILISSNFLLSMNSDDWIYTFQEKTGWDYLLRNIYEWNGRWGQGLTNDYRLYNNRTIVTIISNLLLIGSIFFIWKSFFKTWNAVVFSFLFYITFLVCAPDFFQAIFYFPSLLSYTLGVSISLLIGGILFSKLKRSLFLVSFLLIIQNSLVESFPIVWVYIFGVLIIFDFLKSKRLNKTWLWYCILSIVSFAVIYFSPGNIIRRQNYESPSISFSSFSSIINKILEFFSSHIKFEFLLFIVSTWVLFNFLNSKIDFKKVSITKILVLGVPAFLIPIALGEFTISENSQMRLNNTASIYFLVFVVIVTFKLAHHYNEKVKIKKPAKIISGVLVLFGLLAMLSNNNVHVLISQITTHELAYWNEEETARRNYLLNSYNGKPKSIPPYSRIYKQHNFQYELFLPEEDKTPFDVMFNNDLRVTINEDLPDIRVMNLLEEVKLGLQNPILETKDFNYYLKNYTLLIQRKVHSNLDDKIISFNNKEYSFNELQNSNYYKHEEKSAFAGIQVSYEQKSIVLEGEDTNLTFSVDYFKPYNKEANPLMLLENKERLRVYNQKKFKVKFKVTVRSDESDVLTLYFQEPNKRFNEKKSQKISLKDGKESTELIFYVGSDIGYPTNYRLDYGNSEGQIIEFEKIVIQHGQQELIIPKNEIKDYFQVKTQWSETIDLDNAIFKAKEVNEKLDPKIFGNQKLIDTLKSINLNHKNSTN